MWADDQKTRKKALGPKGRFHKAKRLKEPHPQCHSTGKVFNNPANTGSVARFLFNKD